ncbi:MAG TPA: response regulator [Candidatus Limnocylindria bacterium]|nr:response regulator [Candidatus Limnocylindria bacterium]
MDDEAEVMEILVELLESRGYAVVTAGSAEEALETMARRPVDLVISDLHLSGASGASLAEDIARRWPPLARRVLLLTGDASALDGGVPYLRKPFSLDEMLQAVAARLSRS